MKTPSKYGERKPDTARPYRLYDAQAVPPKFMPYRNYSIKVNAHNGALIEARWNKGRVVEVIDVRTGRWLGTYKLDGREIEITEPNQE